jgi:lantibiotic biosynthesis protein
MTSSSAVEGRCFIPAEFFLLRTPALPANQLLAWSAADPGAGVDWPSRLQALRASLRVFLDRPEIRHALFVASRSVHKAAVDWLEESDTRKGRKAERALVRYFHRMTTRCTPFGLFSGCSVGRIDAGQPETRLQLSARRDYRQRTRLDFACVFKLTTSLRRDPSLAARLTYWPNTSLARSGDAWHYTETRGDARSTRHLVRLASDEFLNAVIHAAEFGATLETLIRAIRTVDVSVSAEEAREYILGLVDNDVLTHSLEPPATGPDALGAIRDELTSSGALDAAATVSRVADLLTHIDACGVSQDTSAYVPLEAALRSMRIAPDGGSLVQVDLFKPADARLGTALVSELERAMTLLDRTADSREPYALRRFRDRFVRRYERAWVPLLQALDEDAGIGFWRGTDDAKMGDEDGGASDGPTALTRLESLLLRKLASRAAPSDEVVIDESDIATLPKVPHHRGEAFEVMASVICEPASRVNSRDFDIVLRLVSGPPGGRISARFCYLDPEIERGVRDMTRHDEVEDPDAIYAEVVHVPEARLGNILQRPVLRDYEIPFLGRSGASVDRVVKVADLLVSVAEDGAILLYSQRLGKRVIPRLTNAHGFLKPTLPAVYRFLCHLQMQGMRGVGFNWGRLALLPFLPRVRMGRTILACARWRLEGADLDRLRQTDLQSVFAAVQEIRRARQLPRWVAAIDGEDSLLVDLENPLSVDSLAGQLSGKDSVVFEEHLPSFDDLCVVGPEGRYCNEVVVAFQRVEVEEKRYPAIPAALAAAPLAVPSSARSSSPGSEWLYLKLYGSHAALEDVLISNLAPVIRGFAERDAVGNWFFVRYGDPDPHLRVRMHVRSPSVWYEALSRALDACRGALADGRIWKVHLDTYERETARYGGDEGMELAEGMFCADSDALIEILEALQTAADPMPWAVAASGIDRLMASYEPDVRERCALARRLRDLFSVSFHKDANIRRRLAKVFRERRQLLVALQSGHGQNAFSRVVQRAFDRRAERVDAALTRLKALADTGRLLRPPEHVLGSIAHMHFNRVCRTYERFEELAAYDSLGLLYEGLAARAVTDSRGTASVVEA